MRLLPACCIIPACLTACLPGHGRGDKKTVLQYRMDELAKAFAAAHLAFDVLEDEHQIAKLKKAEKLAREVHADVHPHSSLLRGLMHHGSGSSSDPGAPLAPSPAAGRR